MKKSGLLIAVSAFALLLALVLSGCCSTPSCARGSGKAEKASCSTCPRLAEKSGGEEAEIDTPALKALLDSGVKVSVLDARSGKYDDGRRIPGARALSAKASEAEIAADVPDKKALIVTYCSNLQCPASSMLAGKLKTLGYENVIEYPHGIAGWADAGNRVETANK